jgi:hypothetical protein
MKRSTIAAAFVLALLALYVYRFERGESPEDGAERVFRVEEAAIERIEIRQGEKAPLVLEKKEQSWRLTAPVEAAADETEADLLVQNLATMTFDRVVAKASEVKLADFGLDSPRIEVRFRTDEGSERSLSFGGDAPTSSKSYARRDGADEILVLPSHLSLNFDKTDWDLRDKSIFQVEGATEPKRISISRPSGNLVLEKEKGLWRVTEPIRARADRSQASSLASRFRTAEMKELVAERTSDLETYGLAKPERKLSIDFEAPAASSLALSVGAEKDIDYYARVPSGEAIFLLDGSLVAELDKEASELASKRLFEFSTFDAHRFRISRNGSERLVVREKAGEESKWRETGADPPKELDTTAVEDLLRALEGATAREILERPSLAEPALTITVWSGEPEVEEKVVFASPGAESVDAWREGDEVALVLSLDSWNEIDSRLSLEKPASAPAGAR